MTRPVRMEVPGTDWQSITWVFDASIRCRRCQRPIRIGDGVWVRKKTPGVVCARCHADQHAVVVEQRAARAPATPAPRMLRARYRGSCARCRAPIQIDDPIEYDRANRRATCADCAGMAR